MADIAVETPDAAEIASTPTKKTSASGGSSKKTKSVKPKTKSNHPPTSDMVNSAIKSLKERGGSSLQAIKKYIAANYKADTEKLSPFIKKYIKSAVISGVLVQTKGKGASGSFKLAAAGATSGSKAAAPKAKAKKVVKRSPPAKPKSSPAAKKTKVAAKKAPAAKPASPAAKGKKRAAPAPVSAPVEKRAAVAKPKSPSKAKKTTKVPTKKPKAPKPKRAIGGKAKKASPKKK